MRTYLMLVITVVGLNMGFYFVCYHERQEVGVCWFLWAIAVQLIEHNFILKDQTEGKETPGEKKP